MKNLISTIMLLLLFAGSTFAQTEWIAHRSHSGKDVAFHMSSIYTLGAIFHQDFRKDPIALDSLFKSKIVTKDGVQQPKKTVSDSTVLQQKFSEESNVQTTTKTTVVVTETPTPQVETTTTTTTVIQEKPKRNSMLPLLLLMLTAPFMIGLAYQIRKLG
jgi:hypothetical protein